LGDVCQEKRDHLRSRGKKFGQISIQKSGPTGGPTGRGGLSSRWAYIWEVVRSDFLGDVCPEKRIHLRYKGKKFGQISIQKSGPNRESTGREELSSRWAYIWEVVWSDSFADVCPEIKFHQRSKGKKVWTIFWAGIY